VVIEPVPQSVGAEIEFYCRRLYEKGYAPARSGNISVRVEEKLLITPSGWSLSEMEARAVVTVLPDGQVLATGELKPSSELPMHRQIYTARPDIGAIIHAHPPKATALSVTGKPFNNKLMAELIMHLGDEVPMVPYHLPGSDALADAIAKTIRAHDCLLMANHGVITTGATLKDAYYQLELLEFAVEVYLTSRQLGQVNELSRSQVEEIHQTLCQAYQPY
jgi:L-fuculose-phosphate aldolase